MFRSQSLFACLLFAVALCACGTPAYDGTPLGKQAAIDAANQALSGGDCSGALTVLLPIYNSKDSDNDIRRITASAYACSAGINFFDLMGEITSNAAKLAGPGFWELMTEFFPSTAAPTDRIVEATDLSIDALQSMIKSGTILLPANELNATSNNPLSLVYSDRTDDSNAYLIFVAMAGIGGIQNRYGNPFPSFKKGNNLPWDTAITVTTTGRNGDDDGCAYAASILNFLDGLAGEVASLPDGGVRNALKGIQSTFGTAINDACDLGCTGGVLYGNADSGCAFPAGACNPCPIALRDRNSCTGLVTDKASCAAAGVVGFVNSNPVGGWITGP